MHQPWRRDTRRGPRVRYTLDRRARDVAGRDRPPRSAEHYEKAVAKTDFPPGNVAAGRTYVAAYVASTHYVEAPPAIGAGSAHPTASHKNEEPAMSPVQRPISGTILTFTLTDEMRVVRGQLKPASRIARTLVKNGALRTTLIDLSPGGALAPHSTDGPITGSRPGRRDRSRG